MLKYQLYHNLTFITCMDTEIAGNAPWTQFVLTSTYKPLVSLELTILLLILLLACNVQLCHDIG